LEALVARKTIDLTSLIETVNYRNRNSKVAPEVREGWNSLLESALHGAGVYSGFNYLREKDVPEGEKPGIVFDHSVSKDHQFPDPSRRFYNVHPKLQK
jgi:hypothetical protein